MPRAEGEGVAGRREAGVDGAEGNDAGPSSAASGAVSIATRHVMQANKSKDTKPELLVRRALREAGLTGYRLHWKQAPGKPDVCFPGRRVAIFVNGCYWHRCPYCALPMPKTNVEFWSGKFDRNRARDERNEERLLADGWTVIVVWECALKPDRREATMARVVEEVRRARESGRAPRRIDAGASRVRHLRRLR